MSNTLMYREASEAMIAVALQQSKNQHLYERIAVHIRNTKPHAIVTCARGSSDHAATFAKYLFETQLGILTSSAAPSVSSIYSASQNLEGTVYMVISQSGQSPDLISSTVNAKNAGAYILVLVNNEDSPLTKLADEVVPLYAGQEKSVAATKSYICTLSAIISIVARLKGDSALNDALKSLPGDLREAWKLNWRPAIDKLVKTDNLFVVGRGLGFSIAQEAALKLKETCCIHAEAFSAAEVKHGPMAIVKTGFPVLIFSQEDGTRQGIDQLVDYFKNRNAEILIANEGKDEVWRLPVLKDVHPACAPLLMILSFYKMVTDLAIMRGYNPDQPRHLKKVTETT